MTYFLEFFKNLTKKNNAGVLIYLMLNVFLLTWIFSSGFHDFKGLLMGLAVYGGSLIVALSPIGEWILRLQMGCKKIERKDYLDRLLPLFSEVLTEARKINPAIPKDVDLFMSNEIEPNAFATGRKTICLTKGFLNYSDDEIKAVFAHEMGHLGNKDTDLILVVTVGNFIITAIFIIFRFFINIVGLFTSIVSRSISMMIVNFFIDVILALAMWAWTKVGLVLVMQSKRKSEYLADEFAFKCGYGEHLEKTLKSLNRGSGQGIWANLMSSHPDIDNRINNLGDLKTSYNF